MKRILLIVAVIALYVLHQDFWFWKTPYLFGKLPFGFLPVGLFYHACFAIAASLLLWMLVKFAWPGHLERELENRSEEEAPK